MKNYLKIIFLLFLVSPFLFSCTETQKKEETQTSTEQSSSNSNTTDENKTENTPNNQEIILKSSDYLKEVESFKSPLASEATKKQLEISFNEAKNIASRSDLSKKGDTGNNYTKKISQLTKLEYATLAEIKQKKGLREIEKIITTLPNNASKKEAQRITTLMRFNRMALSQEAKNYLLSKKDDKLSDTQQVEAYLNPYVEAALLNANQDQEIKLTSKTSPKAAKLSQLTGLSFDKLALIEQKIGSLGLHSVITNIPNFPQKEKALEIILN